MTRTRSLPSSGCPAGEGFAPGYGQEYDADLASLERIGAGGADLGFAEELGDLNSAEDASEEGSSGDE